MNIPEILSILYAILVTVGYIPALISLVKDKTVKGVSNYFWAFVVLTVLISFSSLLVTGATIFQLVSVGVNLSLGVVCLILHSIRLKTFIYVIMTVVLSAILLFNLVAYLPIIQTLATVSIILAYITQIGKFYTTKSSNGTSKYLFLIIGVGLTCLIISMIITGAYLHVIITEVANLVLILICYLQVVYYERKKA